MTYQNPEAHEPLESNGHGKAVFTGVLLGGVAGAVAALLLAPKSGRETRAEIKNRAVEVGERATGKVADAVEQIRGRADQISTQVTEKAQGLKRQGEDVLAEQLGRVAAAAEAGKKELRRGRE